MIKVKKVF